MVKEGRRDGGERRFGKERRTNKRDAEPAHAGVVRPVVSVLPDAAGHYGMGDGHADSAPDGEAAAAERVHEEHGGRHTDELADVDHPREDEGGFVVLADFGEEGWGVVDEGVDAGELERLLVSVRSKGEVVDERARRLTYLSEEADAASHCCSLPCLLPEQVQPSQDL